MHGSFISGINTAVAFGLGISFVHFIHAVGFRRIGSMGVVRVAGTCFGYGILCAAKCGLAAITARGQ